VSRFAIVADGKCLGFILGRRLAYEAYDQDERSLGIFETEDGAVTAITQKLAVSKST
jgi:hypothetical protein